MFLLNTGRVGRQGGRRTVEEGEDPTHVGVREGHRRGHDRLGRGPGLRLPGRRAVPGIDDAELLQPERLYERQGRTEEYDAIVARLEDRAARPPAGLHRSCRRTSSTPSAELTRSAPRRGSAPRAARWRQEASRHEVRRDAAPKTTADQELRGVIESAPQTLASRCRVQQRTEPRTRTRRPTRAVPNSAYSSVIGGSSRSNGRRAQ